jgi:hypothetical protein
MVSAVGLPNPGLELSQDQFGLFRVFSEEPLYEIVRRKAILSKCPQPPRDAELRRSCQDHGERR